MESAGAQTAARSPQRAAAERDMLLELLAVFTHDLSNPLQSITVLCELGMDGGAGDDVSAQCLSAAERMRTLIHGLSGFTRGLDRPSEVGLVGDRLQALLARRFDRHQLQATFDYEAASSIVAPSELEFCLMTLCLGIVATASDHRTRGTFCVTTEVGGETTTLVLQCQTDEGQPLPPTPKHLERARAIGGDVVTIDNEGPRTTLRFG